MKWRESVSEGVGANEANYIIQTILLLLLYAYIYSVVEVHTYTWFNGGERESDEGTSVYLYESPDYVTTNPAPSKHDNLYTIYVYVSQHFQVKRKVFM